MSRPPDAPDVESSTDEYARRFAGPVGAWFLEVQAQHTLALLPADPRPLRILDVGGGHAQLAPSLIAAGHHVTVLGSAPACGNRLQPWIEGGRCRFDVAPLTALPYRDGSFDVALSFRILSHLDDPGALIKELCRVARLRVVVDYPARLSVNIASGRLFPLKRAVEGDTRPYRTYGHGEIRRAFQRHGFWLSKRRPQFLFPMVLHRRLASPAASRLLEAPARMVGLTWALGSPVIAVAERMDVWASGDPTIRRVPEPHASEPPAQAPGFPGHCGYRATPVEAAEHRFDAGDIGKG